MLNLSIGAAESGGESAGSHGAGHAHFALATHLRSADGGILLIEDADGRRGQEEAHDAFVVGVGNEAVIIKRHGGNHAGRAIGGRSDHAAARGVLFIHSHGVDGYPVERGERIAAQIAGFLLAQPRSQTIRAAPNIQASGQNAFSRDAALDAGLHGEPEALNTFAHDFDGRLVQVARGHQVSCDDGALVLKHELADGDLVGLRRGQQLRCAVKGKRNGGLLLLLGG